MEEINSVLSPDGFLLINKPAGITSHDVVNIARKKLGIKKIGHAGTLDPMATGLLILGVGKATKKLGTLIGLPKTYEAEITLGATSTTDDKEGEIKDLRNKNDNLQIPTDEEIMRAIKKFTGEQEQMPPAFSALKINGKRAYKIARQGGTPELKPRKITVYELKLNSYNYPLISLTCNVSSGTYIRSLARDIGKELGTGGYLSKLCRTSIGKYKIDGAINVNGNWSLTVNDD